MNKKFFIVSDVHSFYDELVEALNKQGFDLNNENHIFVSLGDLLDRGPKSLECLQFVNSLPSNRKILIKGNHEDLMLDLLLYKHFGIHDIHNGTNMTVYQVLKEDPDTTIRNSKEVLEAFSKNKDWLDYINSCINYYEDANNVFVHGWIPVDFNQVSPWRDDDVAVYTDDWRDMNWKEARWLNGMNAWAQGARIPDKTIWCGHWHSSWGHANLHNDGKEWLDEIETYYIDPETGKQMPYVRHDPFKDDGICAMDACTAVSGIVNCEVLDIQEDN